MMRLTRATIAKLPATIARPGYDFAAQQRGIVHIGMGAFHRAHQAVYTDCAMNAGDRDWGITGISLRSADVAEQLVPQAGLYTVTVRSSTGSATRLIGAVQEVLVARVNPADVIAAIANAHTHIVSFTITEKGYLRHADASLDMGAQAVANDLDVNATPQTIYGFLHTALARRKAAGLPGLTLLCCDNLAHNGEQLSNLLGEFLQRVDRSLAQWFQTECSCPSTMVDRIVPASTPSDRDALDLLLSVRDEAAVITEPFSQWVIEDRFAGPRPRWETFGAQFVSNVQAYELAKLRMLNGAHSALAYLGLMRGHIFVHEAIADAQLASIINRLMRDEAQTSLGTTPGQDLSAYADALLQRFANSALAHRLSQIAMDGSQKIPQRWLETLRFHQQNGKTCPAILQALAAWIMFVRGDKFRVDDPVGPQLARHWIEQGKSGIVNVLFGESGLFAKQWVANAADINIMGQYLDRDSTADQLESK